MVEIAAALSGLKTALDLARTAIDARDGARMAEAKSVFLERIIDVQTACLQLQQEKQALVDQNKALADRAMELDRALMQIRDADADIAAHFELWVSSYGATVYRSKPGEAPAGNTVYLCANCAQAGKKTFLSPGLHSFMFTCPNGHGEIRI